LLRCCLVGPFASVVVTASTGFSSIAGAFFAAQELGKVAVFGVWRFSLVAVLGCCVLFCSDVVRVSGVSGVKGVSFCV